jgi:hypothetical protein
MSEEEPEPDAPSPEDAPPERDELPPDEDESLDPDPVAPRLLEPDLLDGEDEELLLDFDEPDSSTPSACLV